MRHKSMVLQYSVALLCVIAGSSVAQERSVLAQVLPAPSAPTLSFGMIGLSPTSSARLNVVNLVRTPPPILIPQLPCKAELDLYDSQGKLVKQKTIVNLGYGQADFLDAARSDIVTPGTHVEITGVVKVGSNQSVFCSIAATLEVFDSVSGVTTAILTNPSTSAPVIVPLAVNLAPSQP